MKKVTRLTLMILTIFVLLMSAACGAQDAMNGTQSEQPGLQKPVRLAGPYPALVSYVGEKKYGYIDATGAFVIEPVFGQAFDFQENGLAVAGTAELAGVIDRTGKYVIAPKFDSVGTFRDGAAVAQMGNKMVVIDTKGRILYESTGYISDFSDGRALVYEYTEGDQWLYGYIDNTGKVVIPPQYQSAFDFRGGRAVVKLRDGTFALIDRNGTALRTFNYADMGNISEGLMAFQPESGGKYGYVNEKGQVVIQPQFSSAQEFMDGMAVVNAAADFSGFLYGAIDKRGRTIIQPQFSDIRILGEDKLAVGKPLNAEYPFMDSIYAISGRDGKFLTDFIYYGVGDYKNDLASAYDNTTTFFIGKTGQRVGTLPAVKGIGTLTPLGDIIRADIDQQVYYIDGRGNVVYKPADQVVLTNRVTVRQIKYRPNRNYLVYYPQVSGLDNKEVENSINARLKSMSITADVTPDMELDYTYTGDFDIEFYQKNLIVFELSGYNYPMGAAHGMPRLVYVHVDIKSGRFYELKDLFKKDSDYVKVLSDIIGVLIKEHGEEMGIWPDQYKGIAPDQPFYVTKDALIIYFEPYEIAPYAAGFPTFTLPYKEINPILNKEGAFWRSFH